MAGAGETGNLVQGAEPEAFASGWVAPQGQPRDDSVFVLANDQLGIGHATTVGPPVWIDLQDVVNLDAIGDPHDHRQVVEISLDDGRVIAADWPESFVDDVLAVLVRLAGAAPEPPAGAADAAGALPPTVAPRPVSPFEPRPPVVPGPGPAPSAAAPAPAPFPTAPAPAPSLPAPAPPPSPTTAAPMFGAGAATPAEPASAAPAPAAPALTVPASAPTSPPLPPAVTPGPPPGPGPATPPEPGVETGAATLVLEDVVYLGGYPGHGKKRKKCVATLDRTGLEVKGPGSTSFRLDWDAVRSIEAQNADEARFRMNAKIHRDATALVLECQQDVTVLLEARDCPTVPLRSAIAQLVDGLRVVVV